MVAHQVANKAQVELGLKVPVEVVGRHQVVDGAITERSERPFLDAEDIAALRPG